MYTQQKIHRKRSQPTTSFSVRQVVEGGRCEVWGARGCGLHASRHGNRQDGSTGGNGVNGLLACGVGAGTNDAARTAKNS